MERSRHVDAVPTGGRPPQAGSPEKSHSPTASARRPLGRARTPLCGKTTWALRSAPSASRGECTLKTTTPVIWNLMLQMSLPGPAASRPLRLGWSEGHWPPSSCSLFLPEALEPERQLVPPSSALPGKLPPPPPSTRGFSPSPSLLFGERPGQHGPAGGSLFLVLATRRAFQVVQWSRIQTASQGTPR